MSKDEETKPSDEMTIGQAKEFYAERGRMVYSDDVDLVNLIQDADWEKGIPNSNYVHALSLTELIFSNTRKSLLMLTGQTCDGFISCLLDSFTSMLKRFRQQQGAARIITINAVPEQMEKLHKLEVTYGDVLTVRNARASEESKLEHFIVADKTILRDEKYHPPLTDQNLASAIQATVYFDNERKATVVSRRFGTIWELLVPKSK